MEGLSPLAADRPLTRRALLGQSAALGLLFAAGSLLPATAWAESTSGLESEDRERLSRLIGVLALSGAPGVTSERADAVLARLEDLYASASSADRTRLDRVLRDLRLLDSSKGKTTEEQLGEFQAALEKTGRDESVRLQVAMGLVIGPAIRDDFTLDTVSPALHLVG